MLKNNVFTKTVSLTVIGSFVLALVPEKSRAQMLTPVSFSQMYYLAQNGEVEALRGSVRRGMNIDVMNQNGDTGLCIAAKRGDSYTYNAFRAAGANPRHPCTQNVPNYEDFLNSAKTTPIGSTSRAAYSMMGKEAYSVSPWVYWAAGAVVVGAGAGIALSGGGGGGGDAPVATPVVNKIDSAGKNLASNGQIRLSAGHNENKTNSTDRSMTNSNTSISDLNFNKDVTKSGAELNVILSAEDGGTYTNSDGADLTAKSGVVAMSAYKDSTISNNGALKVYGYNAALGMLAGQNSFAVNNGSDTNGIYLTFMGYQKDSTHDDTIIGMYADSGSTIRNNGLIKGTAALTTDEQFENLTPTDSTATKGSMIGMEVMVVNDNTDSTSTISRAINDGTIDLVAGQDSTGSSLSVEVGIVGMGTYLDEGFLSKSKNINRGEKAEITNRGNINLSYVGKYSSAGDYIKNGIGGIVGMKADANGTATNTSNINIAMSSTDSNSSGSGSGSGSGSATNYAVAAGMQSVHGGKIVNNGTITTTVSADDNRVSYGMIAVKGSGDVSGLYNISPTVINNGEIKMQISNGYGMASYADKSLNNGGSVIYGTLQNNNTIILGAEGDNDYSNDIGMYTDTGSNIENSITGEIIIYAKDSVAMQNDNSGAVTITNDGTITINSKATGSHPFAGKYSNIINNGTIDYQTGESSGNSNPFPKEFTFALQNAVVNTNGENTLTSSSSSSSSTPSTSSTNLTKDITNSATGIIQLTGSSYTAAIATDSKYGTVLNNGTIKLNTRSGYNTYQSVGIYSTSTVGIGSAVKNMGEIYIYTEYSGGIVSDATTEGVIITNGQDGKIYVKGENSAGMYASASASVYNYGTIDVNAANSYAIIAKGTGEKDTTLQQKIYNIGTILLSAEGATAFYTGVNSTATLAKYIDPETEEEKTGKILLSANNTLGLSVDGTMTISDISSVDNNKDATDDFTKSFIYFSVGGTLNIEIPDPTGNTFTKITNATFVKATSGGTVNNYSNFITNDTNIHLFEGLAGSTITNYGKLTLNQDNTYGIYTGGTATNSGTITVDRADETEETKTYAYGMYTTASEAIATNQATINVTAGHGMHAAAGTIDNKASITVNGSSSYGMYVTGGNATNTENGMISVSGNGKGMFVESGTATNSATITVTGNSYGMYAKGGTATNGKNITVSSAATGSTPNYGMYAAGGTVENSDTITVYANSYGVYTTGESIGRNSSKIDVVGANAVGMYAKGGTVENSSNGEITVSGSGAWGMAADSGAIAINYGKIYVEVADAVGMYAVNGGTLINSNTIEVKAAAAIGMDHTYASSYTKGTIKVEEEGGIEVIPPEPEATPAPALSMAAPKVLSTTGSGKIINNGLISTNSALDFGDSTDNSGSISVGDGGSYIAPSFSGNVVADSNITFSGFENEYINENSFVGEDNGLNITSGSYLFDVQKSLNATGNTDVIMTKKDFADVVENSSLAEFLEENYAEKNNESLYVALKSAENSAQFEQNLNSLFGQDLLSDLTFEDLNLLRELQFDMNNKMFTQEKGSFALADGIEAVKGEKFGSTGQYALSGYNDGTTAVAVGLSVTDVKSSANKNNKNGKLNKNIMLSMPISRKAGGFELITSPKLGLARGSYEREGLNGENYNGTVERKTFALMNEARYPLKINDLKVIPSAEFNMIGYNIKAREDKKQYSLNIDSQNHYSVESGLGLNLEKEFAPYTDSKIKLSGGIAVYKEFADPYELKVGMNEMNGSYKLKDESRGDKRTVLRFGARYNLKENIDISAMIRTNIDREYRTDTGVNLNYHF